MPRRSGRGRARADNEHEVDAGHRVLKRRAPNGCLYSQHEFRTYFGGRAQWDAASATEVWAEEDARGGDATAGPPHAAARVAPAAPRARDAAAAAPRAGAARAIAAAPARNGAEVPRVPAWVAAAAHPRNATAAPRVPAWAPGVLARARLALGEARAIKGPGPVPAPVPAYIAMRMRRREEVQQAMVEAAGAAGRVGAAAVAGAAAAVALPLPPRRAIGAIGADLEGWLDGVILPRRRGWWAQEGAMAGPGAPPLDCLCPNQPEPHQAELHPPEPNQPDPHHPEPNQPHQPEPNQPHQPEPNRAGANRVGPNRAGPNRAGPNRAGPNRFAPNQPEPNGLQPHAAGEEVGREQRGVRDADRRPAAPQGAPEWLRAQRRARRALAPAWVNNEVAHEPPAWLQGVLAAAQGAPQQPPPPQQQPQLQEPLPPAPPQQPPPPPPPLPHQQHRLRQEDLQLEGALAAAAASAVIRRQVSHRVNDLVGRSADVDDEPSELGERAEAVAVAEAVSARLAAMYGRARAQEVAARQRSSELEALVDSVQARLLRRSAGTVDAESEELEDACIVCWMRPKTHVLIPCGHQSLCSECCKDYHEDTVRPGKRLMKRCLICQEKVMLPPLRVYHS